MARPLSAEKHKRKQMNTHTRAKTYQQVVYEHERNEQNVLFFIVSKRMKNEHETQFVSVFDLFSLSVGCLHFVRLVLKPCFSYSHSPAAPCTMQTAHNAALCTISFECSYPLIWIGERGKRAILSFRDYSKCSCFCSYRFRCNVSTMSTYIGKSMAVQAFAWTNSGVRYSTSFDVGCVWNLAHFSLLGR